MADRLSRNMFRRSVSGVSIVDNKLNTDFDRLWAEYLSAAVIMSKNLANVGEILQDWSLTDTEDEKKKLGELHKTSQQLKELRDRLDWCSRSLFSSIEMTGGPPEEKIEKTKASREMGFMLSLLDVSDKIQQTAVAVINQTKRAELASTRADQQFRKIHEHIDMVDRKNDQRLRVINNTMKHTYSTEHDRRSNASSVDLARDMTEPPYVEFDPPGGSSLLRPPPISSGKQKQSADLPTFDEISDAGGISRQKVKDSSDVTTNPRIIASEAMPVSNDPFSFNATIVFIAKGASLSSKIPCRGKMDTGSRENWVSRRIIASTHLEYMMKPLENPRAYRAFGGDVFFPIGEVEIQWYLDDTSQQSRKTTFLVGDEVPFDMVVGSLLIQQEDLLARREAALGVRVVEPTEEELAQMEMEAESGSRSRQQLTAIQRARKARQAEERERKRRQQQQQQAPDPMISSLSIQTSNSGQS